MRQLKYQQDAVNELTDKTIKLLNLGTSRTKIVFDAPTGSGKTVMACQALANIVDELKNRGDSKYQEVAFIWFAPRKLHLQSYAKLKGAFAETRKLHPVMFDELEQSEGIQPGEILFVNWESVNKENNIMVRDSESSASLYEITRKTQEEYNLPIIVVIDEEHMFWSKTADKSADVLKQINPAVEIRISATPKTKNPNEIVRVYRKDVIEAEMIKKEVVLNPDIELDFNEERTMNQNLIQVALEKRNQIAEAYKSLGVGINPLLLIQLPNDSREAMTQDDEDIAEQVRTYLSASAGITEENGLLAVWLAKEKSNLANLEDNNNLAQVLLFKEAIALGWDCPRAAVLLIFRKLQSDEFTTQTVGRILRMPEQKFYSKDLLNSGYVYTDIAKDKIKIVAADAGYIQKDILIAKRRPSLDNVVLPSYYSERPNIERNYLGPDFKNVLYATAEELWGLEHANYLFSFEQIAAMDGEDSFSLPTTDDEQINDNRRRAACHIKLDVATVNIEIPTDVHFQNEEQILEVNQVKFARKVSEINRVFLAYISHKGNQFESKGRTDKIANYLLEFMSDYFGIFDTDAKKVVLYYKNKTKFDNLLDKALEKYALKRRMQKQKSEANRTYKSYGWEVPEERMYESETNHIQSAHNHAMIPFIQINNASETESRFEKYLEDNSEYIEWWYKNGDKGKQHYAIPYKKENESGLFYIDFVIKMKNGHIYLFDTKTMESDMTAPMKHNALLDYMQKHSTEEAPLFGGVIIPNKEYTNWYYCKLPIENTSDISQWDAFYPDNA